MTFAIGCGRGQIGYLNSLLGFDGGIERPVRRRLGHVASLHLGKFSRHVVRRHKADSAFLIKIERAEPGLAELRRVSQEALEHRLQVAGRTADDLEHLRGSGLLLQRLAQISGALAQLVEQPRVLDRDRCLRREVLDQIDLFVGEGRAT